MLENLFWIIGSKIVVVTVKSKEDLNHMKKDNTDKIRKIYESLKNKILREMKKQKSENNSNKT